ncbi:MAG: FAD-dependent oxidoreductase, partial [Nitrospinota bacterium]
IRVRDRLNGEEYDIRARLIVSAVGPWADQVERMLNPQAPRRLRTTKGIHLLTPKFVNHAVVMLARRDGRVFFAIPWEGYTLIGTTDTDYTGDLDRIPTTVGDVEYLVEEIRYHFPSLSLTEIYTTTAGVRPLVPRREGGSPSDTSRRHRLFDHRQEGIEGVLSVLGGKITDYRLIAEQTVDVIEARLGRKHVPCQTASTPLIGGQMEDFQEFLAREVEQGQKQGVDPFCLEHLIRTYGSRYPEVLKLGQQDPTLLEPITPSTPSILAQVVYGVQHEMVRTSADLLIRRLGLILHPGEGLEALDRISPLLGKLLHWTPEQQEQDRQAYLDEVTLRHVS